MASPLTDDDVLVYMEGGTAAHVLPWDGSPNRSGQEAVCGRSAWPMLWSGTGDQDEHERARELRLCAKCEAVIKHQRLGAA